MVNISTGMRVRVTCKEDAAFGQLGTITECSNLTGNLAITLDNGAVQDYPILNEEDGELTPITSDLFDWLFELV